MDDSTRDIAAVFEEVDRRFGQPGRDFNAGQVVWRR